MKIVAATNEGFLLAASEQEIKSLLVSFGVKDPKPQIGIEIPAADFSRQVTELKTFGSSYDYRQMKETISKLNKAVESVDKQLNSVTLK